MNVEDLVRRFQEQRYASSALPGLSGSDMAGLLGERIRQEGDVIEVSTAFFYRDPRDLARRFGEWLAGQGYGLTACPEPRPEPHGEPRPELVEGPVEPLVEGPVEGPAHREDQATAEAEVVLQAQERPGSGLAVAYYRLVEKGAPDA